MAEAGPSRYHARMLRFALVLLSVWPLAGCGSDPPPIDFLFSTPEGMHVPDETFSMRTSWEAGDGGGDAIAARLEGLFDSPHYVDEEVLYSVHLHFAPGALGSVSAGDVLVVDGEVTFADEPEAWTFAAGPEHDARIPLAAFVQTGGWYEFPVAGTQTIEGTVTVRSVGTDRLGLRVDLDVDGMRGRNLYQVPATPIEGACHVEGTWK